MRAALLALSGAVMLGGCASDKLTLFENEDGNATGAVAVIDEKTGEDKAVVSTALTEAKLSSRPKPRAVKQLNPAYTALLDNLPPKAATFPITFKLGATKISEDQRGVLAKIRDELSIRPGAQIEVVGFTDSTGGDELNDLISLNRAKTVAAELRDFGFPVEESDAVGRGEDAAKAKNGNDVEDEAFRTVIVLIR